MIRRTLVALVLVAVGAMAFSRARSHREQEIWVQKPLDDFGVASLVWLCNRRAAVTTGQQPTDIILDSTRVVCPSDSTSAPTLWVRERKEDNHAS